MHRYVGLMWDPRDTPAVEVAEELSRHLEDARTGWVKCCRTASMVVYVPRTEGGRDHLHPLPMNLGVILGRLFPVDAELWRDAWHPDLQRTTAESFVRSGGSTLADHFWGSYVAFLCNPADDSNYVLRDCSGAVPCYFTTHRKVSIVFSDVNDLSGFGLPPFELDPEYLSAFIYWPELQINRCAIRGVTEILAGQRLHQKHGIPAVSSLWNPCEIARRDPLDSAPAARAALRSMTEYCIAAWASTYSTVALSLSGGLDSAIVLGCLGKAMKRPRVICVNRYNSLPGEDERPYARRAAGLGGCEFVELPWCSTGRKLDESLLAFPKTPKPFVPLPFVLLDADSWNEVTMRYQTQAVWTGQGGDHIFFNMPTSLGAADYIQTHPWLLSPRRTFAAIIEAARYAKEPYISVWRNARSLARARGRWKSDIQAARLGKSHVSFVVHEALPENIDEYLVHPCLAGGNDLPKGKQLQIELLLELLNRDRFGSVLYSTREHHPLISQPLIELSLRIPIHVLTLGGRQRGLARQAFAEVVPAEILAREDKGGTTLLWINKIRENQPFLRNLLLDGWLARHGIVDEPSLDPYLSGGFPIRTEQWGPLAACIAAEMWARSWNSETGGSRL